MSRDMAGLVHYHARILAGKQVEDHIHSKAYTFITRQHLTARHRSFFVGAEARHGGGSTVAMSRPIDIDCLVRDRVVEQAGNRSLTIFMQVRDQVNNQILSELWPWLLFRRTMEEQQQ